jgi:hypothetical protein
VAVTFPYRRDGPLQYPNYPSDQATSPLSPFVFVVNNVLRPRIPPLCLPPRSERVDEATVSTSNSHLPSCTNTTLQIVSTLSRRSRSEVCWCTGDQVEVTVLHHSVCAYAYS